MFRYRGESPEGKRTEESRAGSIFRRDSDFQEKEEERKERRRLFQKRMAQEKEDREAELRRRDEGWLKRDQEAQTKRLVEKKLSKDPDFVALKEDIKALDCEIKDLRRQIAEFEDMPPLTRIKPKNNPKRVRFADIPSDENDRFV